MDRRSEPRVSLNEAAWITVLGPDPVRLPGAAVDLSGRGMKLSIAQPLSPDTPVKVETNDSLYLGEICYCLPEQGRFVVGVQIDQVLTGLKDLARLRRNLGADEPRCMLTEHTQATGREKEDRQIRKLDRARV